MNAQNESLKLANSIEANAIAHPYKYVHLIGHSAGARLIDLTAKKLAKIQPSTAIPFMYLSFLDAYAPNGSGRATYGSISSPHFSEHYVDRTFSHPIYDWIVRTNDFLSQAFNFEITNWDMTEWQAISDDDKRDAGHQWPRYWYQKSVSSSGFRYGFPLSFDAGNDLVGELGKTYPRGRVCDLRDQSVTCEVTTAVSR